MDNRNIFVTMVLKDELTGKVKQIEGGLASARRELNTLTGSTNKQNRSFSQLTGTILKSAPAFAVATAAITGVYQGIRAITDEITAGLKSIEDYNLAVATMAGFMTSFSERAREGDLAGAFEQSVAYSICIPITNRHMVSRDRNF